MIKNYNREQLLRGLLNLVLGAGILFITWWFFRLAGSLVWGRLWARAPISHDMVATALTAVVFASGAIQWSRGGESYRVFKDTDFYASLNEGSAGGFVTQHYVHRITGVAYVLSQIFLGGPWQICKGYARLRSRLPNDPKLEDRMREVLGWMRASGQWETAIKYRDNAEELGALIRCGLVEFSATKMRVKAIP